MQKIRKFQTKPWGRQHVRQDGSPKVRFLTEYAAQKAVDDIHTFKPDQEFEIYICQICFYYHVGRKAKPENRYWAMLEEAKKSRFDEREVGKLVAALRAILDHPRP